MQAQVIKPVDTCETCQSQFKEMKQLYGMYKACPGDPGAAGLLQASVLTYNQHHKDKHPVHPDAVKPGQVVAECEPIKCAYEDCTGEGKHQCPKCHRWFCDKCRELFLPIDPMFWAQTAMMCPQCHYQLNR